MAPFPSKIGHYRDGTYRRNVIKVSTASTAAYDVKQEDSGSVLFFGTVSTVEVKLPRISSKWLGLEYTIYFSTADAASDYTINCKYDSSAGIWIPGMSSDGVGTPSTITPMSTIWPHAIRVTAISSVVWLGEPFSMVGDITSNAIQDEDFEGGCWTTA